MSCTGGDIHLQKPRVWWVRSSPSRTVHERQCSMSNVCNGLRTPARSRAINVLSFQRVTNSGGRGVCGSGRWPVARTGVRGEQRRRSMLNASNGLQTPVRSRALIFSLQVPRNPAVRAWTDEDLPSGGPVFALKPGTNPSFLPHFLTDFRVFTTRSARNAGSDDEWRADRRAHPSLVTVRDKDVRPTSLPAGILRASRTTRHRSVHFERRSRFIGTSHESPVTGHGRLEGPSGRAAKSVCATGARRPSLPARSGHQPSEARCGPEIPIPSGPVTSHQSLVSTSHQSPAITRLTTRWRSEPSAHFRPC